MVEGHVGDHAHAKLQDAGRIEAPAEADLADQQVDSRASEVIEGGRGQDLELGGRTELRADPGDGGLKLADEGGEVGLRDGELIDLDALGIGDEVWLGHEAHAIARLLQDRGEHGADRALAIGPAHVDALE